MKLHTYWSETQLIQDDYIIGDQERSLTIYI